MVENNIASGVVHSVPDDFKETLTSSTALLNTWNNLTPLARNEWICWITSAKKEATRVKRTNIAKENLLQGKKRPCCWPGCPHRQN